LPAAARRSQVGNADLGTGRRWRVFAVMDMTQEVPAMGEIVAQSVSAGLISKAVWMSAAQMIAAYGTEALHKAAEESEYYSMTGDMAAEAQWNKLASAIALLIATEGELPN
jgi:hypothetical protein